MVNLFISRLCPGCVMVVGGSGSYLRIFVSMSGLCCGRFGKGLVSFVVSCPYPGCVMVGERKRMVSLVVSCLYLSCYVRLRKEDG